MAEQAYSTPVPSRRDFFKSAAAAGACAGNIAVPVAADAALLAMAPSIDALIRAVDRAYDAQSVAEGTIAKMIGPRLPRPKRDDFVTFAQFREAEERYDEDCRHCLSKQRGMEGHAGYRKLERAVTEADGRLLTATRRLAEMPALTLDGLICKARYVERGADEELKDSIVADLLAMRYSSTP